MIFEKKGNGSQLYLLHQNAAQWRKFSHVCTKNLCCEILGKISEFL
jgi:hypothetical protein